jgi:hypothetical protein
MLSASSMQGPGGAIPYVTFEHLDDLTAALRSINVHKEHIDEAQTALAAGEAFSIPNVLLTDEDLAKLGLKKK